MKRRRRGSGHTSNGRGTLLIERTFPPPIGAVRLASGTHDALTLRDVNAMLDTWIGSVPPRWDLVEAVARKTVKPLHALTLYRQNRTEEIPRADVLPPLTASVAAWLERFECSDAYRGQVRSTFKALGELGTGEATIADLPQLLKARRDACQDAGTRVGFNRGKCHVQAFVRDTLGDDHALYRAVSKVAALGVEDTTRRRALPPAEVAEYLGKLPPADALMAWSLAVTGMRPKEYWSRPWGLQLDRVSVGKSKTEAGRRDIPLWAPALPVLPTRTRDAFEGMWERRLGGELGVYDLRRSFEVWMEDAHITRSRRKIYLGHAIGDVTDIYERRELDAWLKQDAEALDRLAGDVVRTALDALQPQRLVVVA